MIDLIRQRLSTYRSASPLEEEQAIKEILQEIALYLLWRGGFFEVAAFQGGTSLRILHRLPRFSEDLDFILQTPDPKFEWARYLNPLLSGLTEFGLQSEVLDRSDMDRNVRQALLKNDSVASQLNLSFYKGRSTPTLKIKLEIDVNPPAGSGFAHTFLDFPLDYEVCHQDLPSNFSLKIHALLCRPYIKGRDWFDFNWYVRQRVQPNLTHLRFALQQAGPWKGKITEINSAWVVERLKEKIEAIDWRQAAADVERFLGPAERESLKLWSVRFFLAKLGELHQGK